MLLFEIMTYQRNPEIQLLYPNPYYYKQCQLWIKLNCLAEISNGTL